jgi:hypothetical protein
MTNEQFNALMNTIDAAIDAKLALHLNWAEHQYHFNYGFTAEQTAR